jgi:hypothetical protein
VTNLFRCYSCDRELRLRTDLVGPPAPASHWYLTKDGEEWIEGLCDAHHERGARRRLFMKMVVVSDQDEYVGLVTACRVIGS